MKALPELDLLLIDRPPLLLLPILQTTTPTPSTNYTQDTNRPVSFPEDEVAASHAISRANWSAAEREAGHLLPPFGPSVPYPSVSAPGPSSETGDAQCGSESHRRSLSTVSSSEYSSTGSPVPSGQERVDFRNPAPCSPVSPGSARIDTHSYPPRCSPEATHSPAESHPPRDPKTAEKKPRRPPRDRAPSRERKVSSSALPKTLLPVEKSIKALTSSLCFACSVTVLKLKLKNLQL